MTNNIHNDIVIMTAYRAYNVFQIGDLVRGLNFEYKLCKGSVLHVNENDIDGIVTVKDEDGNDIALLLDSIETLIKSKNTNKKYEGKPLLELENDSRNYKLYLMLSQYFLVSSVKGIVIEKFGITEKEIPVNVEFLVFEPQNKYKILLEECLLMAEYFDQDFLYYIPKGNINNGGNKMAYIYGTNYNDEKLKYKYQSKNPIHFFKDNRNMTLTKRDINRPFFLTSEPFQIRKGNSRYSNDFKTAHVMSKWLHWSMSNVNWRYYRERKFYRERGVI